VFVANGRLLLGCWTEKGTRSWKIFSWEWSGEKLTLAASRRMGADHPVIELVPRAAAKAIALTVRQRGKRVAKLWLNWACANQPAAKMSELRSARVRVAVSRDARGRHHQRSAD